MSQRDGTSCALFSTLSSQFQICDLTAFYAASLDCHDTN